MFNNTGGGGGGTMQINRWVCFHHTIMHAVDGRSLQYVCIQLNVNLQISTLFHGFHINKKKSSQGVLRSGVGGKSCFNVYADV